MHCLAGLLSVCLLYRTKCDMSCDVLRGIEESKSRALDNLGRVYARQGNFKQAINCWERKLPLAKTSLETTWLYHEIGRCNLELG